MTKVIDYLNNFIVTQSSKIKEWLNNEYLNHQACFYSSVDLRHSGTKIVPVDTNLFPAGFNNFANSSIEKAVLQTRDFLARNHNNAKKILIIAESHTRNTRYLDNILILKDIVTKAGFDVKLAMLGANEVADLTSHSGIKLEITEVKRNGNIIQTSDNFTPDLILLNNDLSEGVPEILNNLAMPIVPSLELGWHQRSKSNHFAQYQTLSERFCREFSLDPFYISAKFKECGKINFKEKIGLECIASNVEKMVSLLKTQYQEHGINEDPYVFIKADKGTYGMGIMTAKSGEEVLEMNKKTRNKMNVLKSGVLNTNVIIQEGIRTADMIDGATAEPLVYLIDAKPIGITYRIHSGKDEYGNLNAAGMHFSPGEAHHSKLENSFDLIARLATLASCREI